MGGGPRAVGGHLPVRPQAPADDRRGAAPDPGLHLDQDPGARQSELLGRRHCSFSCLGINVRNADIEIHCRNSAHTYPASV